MTTIEKFDIDNPDHMLQALREYIVKSYAAPRYPRENYENLDEQHGGWIEFTMPGTEVTRKLAWDQEWWIADDERISIPFAPDCGTACCAGGFANLVVMAHGVSIDKDGNWLDALHRFGLTVNQNLFFASSNTADQMLAMIDALLAEGEAKAELDLRPIRAAVLS